MMDKLNISAVEEYSEAYAKRLTSYFFIDNEVVRGKEILKFSEVQQVNLFTLSALFEAWQQETARMRSPYFDYESEEVQEALKVFMDTVSRFIAVRKEHFELLLTRAVKDTILLLLSPAQYFEQWETTLGHPLSLDRLKEKLRYFQINKFIPKALISRMEEIGQPSVPTSLAIRWVNEMIETQPDQLAKAEDQLDAFSRKLPLDVNAFKMERIAFSPAQPSSDSSVEERLSEVPPTHQEPVSVPALLPIIDPLPVASTLEDQPDYNASQPVSHKVSVAKTHEISLNDRLGRDQQTLNDSLKQVVTKEPTLERHLKTRIENIKSAIPLNQKFVFINELFQGDTAAYHQALNELEQCGTYQAATELLMDKYASNYGWNMEGEEVGAFFEIIERKFY